MARFRLTGPHYIKIQGTEWEQSETDLITGKQGRKRYPVPLYLDPGDPSSCNYPGEVIISNKADRAFPRDLIFDGPPTLDMTPLDEEAEILCAEQLKRGEHPIDSLPSNGDTFGERLLRQLEDKLTTATPAKADDRVAILEQQIAELRELLTAQIQPLKSSGISLGGK